MNLVTKPILILKNTHRENPGLIEIILKENSLKYKIVDFENSTVIESIENHLNIELTLSSFPRSSSEIVNDIAPQFSFTWSSFVAPGIATTVSPLF